MKQMTNEEVFITVVGRVNIYLIVMGVCFLVYFLLKTKIDIFLFLFSMLNMLFALLSHKHLTITNRLAIELERARGALGDVSREMRDIHPDINA
ncbi:MAG: hypothetical protein KJ706_03550 [Candidatus Omnitrophica bacterium]|nr:hypothetical protein [Candidatus Omnitrophota bacterium]MBU4589655.1 hypothetical protein [Candidatus Omnitrophota bacterium]